MDEVLGRGVTHCAPLEPLGLRLRELNVEALWDVLQLGHLLAITRGPRTEIGAVFSAMRVPEGRALGTVVLLVIDNHRPSPGPSPSGARRERQIP